MKNIILIIFAFIIGGCLYSIQAQNTEITVYVTDHSCCPESGTIDAYRAYQGDGIGELYNGPGTYTVYWNDPLEEMEMTTVIGDTGWGSCVVHPGGPSVAIDCYGTTSHLAGNLYPSSCTFYLYLGVRERGSGGGGSGDD